MNTTEEMLQFLYKSASMSVDSTLRILKKARDGDLRRELSAQVSAYRDFASEASAALARHGLKPTDNSACTKVMTLLGIELNTMIDSTSSHIAEIMIGGANMGIIKMNKHLNRNKRASNEASEKCKRLIELQKKNNERLESYLA